MIISCTNCGQSGNIETGSNMGWFDIVINEADGTITIICKDCGKKVEW